jgi:putative membrane protein
MLSLMHAGQDTWTAPIVPTFVLALTAVLYVCGCLTLRVRGSDEIPAWRAAACLLGLLSIWIAVASPLADGDAELLTLHMVQHLLLLSVAPPLIWLGSPVLALLHSLPHSAAREPRSAPHEPRAVWRRDRMPASAGSRRWRQAAAPPGHPVVCWLAGTMTLVGWHIPAALTLVMQSHAWHGVQQATFLAGGLLFWWPVIQPWSVPSTDARWSLVVYLFLATLPCDILAGFLLFSERVAYPVYLSVARQSSLSVLEDQQCAGALMWTSVTIIYFVAAAAVTMRLLSAGTVVTRTRGSLDAV